MEQLTRAHEPELDFIHMTVHGPQAQPEPITAVPPHRPSETNRNIVAGLVLTQLVVSLSFANLYIILVRSGTFGLWHPFLSVAASACLYLATARLVANLSGNRLFAAAALGFALLVPGWRLPHLWALFHVFSSAVAIAGWWVATRSTLGRSQKN